VTLSRVTDRAVGIAKLIADVAGAPGTSVERLIHVGSATSVFDPRNGDASVDGEMELDERCWFDCSDESRKVSDAEAFGSTAAEMLLWARAAGDRVPYTMCSVVPATVLGTLLTPSHASSAGHRLLVDYVARSHAIPPLPIPIVDCRDVSFCVGSLVTTHEHVCGRILLMAESVSSGEIVGVCRSLFPGYPWPSRALPRWAVSSSVAVPWRMSRGAIKARYGRHFSMSQRRAVAEVGVSFRDIESTVRDSIASLSDFGQIDLQDRKSASRRKNGRFSSRLSANIDIVTNRKTASGRV
jgi:hypothetical protein